ncbi:MAG: metallophosphoesterase [Gemmataceae bacterium]
MTRPVRHHAYQRPRRPYFKPRLELLEDRLALAGTPVNFAVIGDYGVASSLLNLPNVILGVPDPEGDVARLVHSWNNDFVVTLGDNNYLVGEQNDANVIQDIELLMDVNKISPATGQLLLDTLANIPFVATTVDGGNTTNLSTTVTFPAGTDLSALTVNMFVVGPGIRPPTAALPFFTQISAIDDAADTITLSIPADGTFTNEDFHFLPADLSLTTLDGLSHIDRNIGRYFSDYIFPYSTTSPGGTGQFGNGSPTGHNQFFPVPGNHDWADVFSNNVFADSEPFAVLAGITGFQLDAYLNFFGPALTAQNSPGFKIGTTLNSSNQEVPLAQPYYYSFTAGQTSAGRPLVEFFAFDSELADPLLTNTFTGTDFSQFTNVNTLTSQEGLWLQRAMASSTALWKIPYFHHTPYTSSGEDGEEGFNGSWMQLPFQQMGASAVLYGHVHNYERLAKADPAIPALNVPAGTKAIPYLLNGFGGASPSPFFGPNDPGSQLRYNGDFGAQKVYADQNRITFQFYNRHGGLIDSYTISQPMTAVAAAAGSAPRVKLINAATGETVLA